MLLHIQHLWLSLPRFAKRMFDYPIWSNVKIKEEFYRTRKV